MRVLPCEIVWNAVSRATSTEEAGVLKSRILLHHAAAIFSLLRSGVTSAAGIEESFIGQLIWSALKIAFLENTVTCKARMDYKYIIILSFPSMGKPCTVRKNLFFK